jgi:hypothetical protein
MVSHPEGQRAAVDSARRFRPAGIQAPRLPSCFTCFNHLRHLLSPALPTMPNRLSRTGLMPTKFKMPRRNAAIPWFMNHNR